MNMKYNSCQLLILLFLLSCCLPLQLSAQADYSNNFIWSEFPDIPPAPDRDMQPGLASPFAGKTGSVIIVAGGCNFPDRPVRDGGLKQYYDDAFVLTEQDGSPVWLSGFKIPRSTAYGASVSLPEGLLCIGGNGSSRNHKEVFLLKWDDERAMLEVEDWPSLPFPISQMGAALIDQTIYVAGGLADGKEANSFLSLDLSKRGSQDFKWVVLEDFPGQARIQPVVVAQNSAEEKRLYVISGSSYPEEEEDPLVSADGMQYSPRTRTWKPVSEIRPAGTDAFSLHGADGIPLGMNHILFIGGVHKSTFHQAWKQERMGTIALESGDTAAINRFTEWKYNYLSQEPDWYQFNREVLVYHTITDSWTVGDEYPFPAPAGARLVPWKEGWLIISGEIMPGVRSPAVYQGELRPEPVFGFLNWSLLIVYLGGMLSLGYFFMKREKGTDDFFKGGGRIPWWAAGMSIYATMLSAITFMAIPAKAYATDWKYYPMAIAILIIAFPVVKYYLPFFRRLKVTTAYEYLEKRFNYTTRFLASFLFILFMIARMALVLFLPSLALTTVTGIDIYTCIILMGIVTIIYCTMGGVEAVIWGDVIQGFVLLGGTLFAAVFLVIEIDGGAGKLIEISLDQQKFLMFDMAFDWKSATLWVVALGGLANNLISYSADQTVIQRYLTTRNERSAGKGILMNGIMSAAVLVVFYFIGTALYAYYKTQPGELNFAMQNTDAIFPHFIMAKMPVGVAGLLIAAIFSATMSTVSSNVNSISTAFTTDFYRHFFPGSSDKRLLGVARWSGILFGGIGVALALLMATLNILSLFDYFNTILGLLASGLGALFLMGIFFPRIGAASALTGFILGTACLLLISLGTEISFLLYGFLGMALTLLFSLLSSLVVPNRRELSGFTWRSIQPEDS
jgi:cyclically-permuted mutarotase family protein